MAIRKDRTVLRQLATLFNVGAIRELTDGQLLERFAAGEREGGELAFAALVERHGPMVLRVCRAQLSDPHDSQDAYQATFLVLFEKARSLWVRETLGPWLHQVAFRTASCARAAAARRRKHEGRAAELVPTWEDDNSASDRSWEQALHAEINRLPDRYRVPIVLCDLEGLTNEEAARRMGRPVGTVKSWRCRGRERLRRRLLRSGLAPAAGLGATLAADRAWSAVLNAELEGLVRTGVGTVSHGSNAGVVPAAVRALVKGVFRAMFISKLRTMASLAFALAIFAAGLGATILVAAGDKEDAVPPAHAAAPMPSNVRRPTAKEVLDEHTKELDKSRWDLSLREAITIGLDNAEKIRLIRMPADNARPGAGLVIAPLKRDDDPQRFRAGAMEHVRSIEQQYWIRTQHIKQLWSIEKASKLVEETLRREQSALEAGDSNGADVGKTRARLEDLQIELAARTADLETNEREFRKILGLPASDGRRIVPATPPLTAKAAPEWEACRATMLKKHPEIARANAQVEAVAAAGAFLLGSSAEGRAHAAQLEVEKGLLQQVIHQTTHDLVKYFLEVKVTYKRYLAAAEASTSAADRWKQHRGYYLDGRIIPARYLAAVNQFTSALAEVAQHTAAYNIALVRLEEAKGTLLEHDGIVVGDESSGVVPAAPMRDLATKPASAPASVPPFISQPDETAKTVTFEMTIGLGPRPVEIRGSFTIKPAELAKPAALTAPPDCRTAPPAP